MQPAIGCKVVQRLPVRVELEAHDGELPLHTGLSATVKVDTRYRRHLFGDGEQLADEREDREPMSEDSRHWAAISPRRRTLITITVMLASVLQVLDNTIANVALPHIQGSLSATQDQMSWVLTSLYRRGGHHDAAHRLARRSRFGRRRLLLVSIVGFTLASALCGIAQSLPQMVVARLLQGLSGAALVPMSQAVLLDINPPERHARAMSVWAMGVTVGPVLGPTLGGWLTENYTWRWVFFINVPIGILCTLGVLAFMRENKRRVSPLRFFRLRFTQPRDRLPAAPARSRSSKRLVQRYRNLDRSRRGCHRRCICSSFTC